MITATPKAETAGLSAVIDGASIDDLQAVGALVRVAKETWGDAADRRIELLVALHLQQRITRHA